MNSTRGLAMLTEQETSDMCRFVTDLEQRGSAADVFTLSRLAAATGDDREKLVRECLSQWRPVSIEGSTR